jgi:hypothetical protein
VTKTLVVIGAVIGFFFLGSLAVFAYGIYWLYGAGDQADTQIAIGPTSIGYVRWVAAEDDPGIEATLRRFTAAFSEAQQGQQQNLPAPLRTLMELQRSQQADSFRVFWPRALTVSFEPGDRFVLALNMRGMGGFVKAMFEMLSSDMMQEGEMQMRPVEHRDREILVPTSTSSSLSFALVGSTILAGEEADLRDAIDRDADGIAVQANARLATVEKMVASGSDFYLVYLEPSDLEEADVGIGLDVVEADRWRGTVVVRAASTGGVALVAAAAEERLRELRASLSERGIEVESHRSDVDPRTLRWDVTITGVATALEKHIAADMNRAPEP